MLRHKYHIGVKIECEHVAVGVLHGQPADFPVTELTFRPAQSGVVYPVRVYWKSGLPAADHERRTAERAVLDYCERLFDEAAYEGPLDCCL